MNDMNKPYVRTYHWMQNRLVQNLGDYRGDIVLEALGFRAISCRSHSGLSVNPGRCLLPIGSVLWNRTFEHISGPIDVWGCGWRGEPLRADLRERISFHAVRGPETVRGLGLPPDIPQGDPALLLPRLMPKIPRQHGKAIIIPHYYRVDCMTAAQRYRFTGCDALVPSRVIGKPVPSARPSPRGIWAMAKARLGLGVPIVTGRQAINAIAGADFVLTGSLHGAILAQAYGVPWASYDDGYVDVPVKWYDWADYLGIQIRFVSTLAEGEQWWQTEGRRGAIRDLTPLLSAFPYPINSAICQQPNRALSSYP